MAEDEPWLPAKATTEINEIAQDRMCGVARTSHAKERLDERGLIMSDVLFVLKNGYVYEDPEPSTIDGLFKYKVEGQSPNSGSRYLGVIAIPDKSSCQIKIVTIMWRDGT